MAGTPVSFWRRNEFAVRVGRAGPGPPCRRSALALEPGDQLVERDQLVEGDAAAVVALPAHRAGERAEIFQRHHHLAAGLERPVGVDLDAALRDVAYLHPMGVGAG